MSSRASRVLESRRRDKNIVSVVDQVYDHMRRAIVSGELQPDQKLVELDIAEQMGTSQAPVREALQRLERDGLVERRARRATFVSRMSQDEIYAIFSVRSVIEGVAIQRAIQRLTPARCSELHFLLEKMREAAQHNDLILLIEHDLTFHRRLCEWSASSTLLNAWLPLYSQIQRFVVQTHPKYFADLVELANTHQPIVEAVCQNEIERARQVVQDHVMLIWSKIKHEQIISPNQ